MLYLTYKLLLVLESRSLYTYHGIETPRLRNRGFLGRPSGPTWLGVMLGISVIR